MGYTKRFAYVKRNSGQLVTYTELENVGKFQRDTLLDILGDVFRGYATTPRNGVINGLAVTSTGAQTVSVARGIGLVRNPGGIAGANQVAPVVVEASFSIALSAPDATNPRYDLIVLRQNPTNSESAVRGFRASDGTLSTASCYGAVYESYDYHVYEGSPAGSPTVVNGTTTDLPIAVVKVAPGIPDVVYDVRGYLNPRVGGTSEYIASAEIDGGGSVIDLSETVTDPTIQIDTSLVYGALGLTEISCIVSIPKVFGTNPAEYFSSSLRPYISSAVSALSVVANPSVATTAGTASHPTAVFNNWQAFAMFYTTTTGVAYAPLVNNVFLGLKFSSARTRRS